MAALHLRALRTALLGPIDLQLAAGELVFLSGPSGAGKSLLLRAIAELDASDGEALIDAAPRAAMSAPRWRRRVGLLPADSGWWADRVGAHFAGTASGGAERDALLARLGFDPGVLDWDVPRLSTGERQRLALARLLANHPEVLLLDEATANLDPDNRAAAEALIDDYRRAHRAAVLWVSHDPEQRSRLAGSAGGRRFVIDAGRLRPEADDREDRPPPGERAQPWS